VDLPTSIAAKAYSKQSRLTDDRGKEMSTTKKVFDLVPNAAYSRPWMTGAITSLQEEEHPKHRDRFLPGL
jgi:hypothetical protein